MLRKKGVYVAATVVALVLAVCLVDAVVHPPYFAKVPIKLLFFFLIPTVFFAVNKEERRQFLPMLALKKKGIVLALLLGVGIYAVIVGGFLLTRGIIDYSNVTSTLTDGMGITADNFLYVSLYISLMNSFLEEFFFRGYGFITLKRLSNRTFACLFSASMFAVYHVGMLWGMFSFPVLLLLLVGLVAGGCIFNFLNEKTDTLYPSWFTHMFANFAINTVGFILFGIL